MADQKSAFPTMGTDAAHAGVASPDPAHTTLVAKQSSKNSGPDGSSASHRIQTQEVNGFKGAPQTTLYKQNAPEASATYRNVRLLPSAKGNDDFYYKRQYGQTPDFG